MRNPTVKRSRVVGTIVLIGLSLGLAASPSLATAQEAPARSGPDAVGQVVAKLRSACESVEELRGAFVQAGRIEDGRLTLTGTIDRAEQAELIEAEGKRLLESSAPWKAMIPGGVIATKLVVFPIRSGLLPQLRRDFAKPGGDPTGRPGLLQQTRIDDLYFDARGRLRVVGLCINQAAYLATRSDAARPADDLRSQIGPAVLDQLKGYPLPQGVAPKVIAHILADRVAFEENPVRRLQRWANDARLDEVLFRDARFDAEGALTIDVLLGDESQRGAAEALLTRPEFVRTYLQPGGAWPAKPPAAVARMTPLPWRKELLSGLQEGLAREANRGTSRSALRYCRVDRAWFTYPGQGGLRLSFEGVVLRPDDSETTAQIVQGIRDESHRLILGPNRLQCGVVAALTRLPNPVGPLQKKVADEPALDGVRLDDLTFGPRGEPTFEGRWIGPAQADTLAAVLTPALTELTRGKVGGPVILHLKETPTDRLLRNLRRKAGAEFNETGLDRLLFLPAEKPDAPPTLTLQGATSAEDLAKVEARLGTWLEEDELARALDGPVVPRFKTRPNGLLRELRKRVAADPALDGVQVRRCYFDEDNSLIVTGLQEREGQGEKVAELGRSAAAEAWRGLSPPAAIRAGSFTTHPVGPLLDFLRRWLPYYVQADKVLLERAYYDEDAALVFAGPTTGRDPRPPDVDQLIKQLLRVDPNSRDIKLSLTPRLPDPEAAHRTVRHAIEALIGGNLAGFDRDALDRAILHDPSSSTAWYLRGAYYHTTGDQELATRDLWRVKEIEKRSPGRKRDRFKSLERFQSPMRPRIDDVMEEARPPG